MRPAWLLGTSLLLACGEAAEPNTDAGTSGPSCPTPTAGPTDHVGYPSADETWTAQGSPHRLTSGLNIGSGITVTVEPCATVELGPGVFLRVEGRLLARGDATHPITFQAGTPGERFASLVISGDGYADLAHVEISGGGAIPATNQGATIEVVGGAFPPEPGIKVDTVTVRGSAGYGVLLRNWAAFDPASKDLTITTAGQVAEEPGFPLRVSFNALSSVPSGRYTGNRDDRIVIAGDSPHYQSEIDDVIRDRDVAYRVGDPGNPGRFEVIGSRLTLEPGVRLDFGSNGSSVGGLDIRANGVLVAAGTSDRKIVFGADDPTGARGAWEGVTFFEALGTGNRLEHLRIQGAGAHGGDTGFGCPPAQPVLGTDAPLKFFTALDASFVSNVEIAGSPAHGIIEAWNGGYVDLAAGNSFSDIAACRVVGPRDGDGNCPANPSCAF